MSLDFGSMNLNELSDLVKKSKDIINNKMAELSDADKIKVNNIVDGVDKTDPEAIKNKIEELNNNKNAV